MAQASPFDEAKDLQQMLVNYAKQETVEPLKTLGAYLAWGIIGAICMFVGILFLALGTLRFFQSNVERFEGGGGWSLAPYGITVGVLVVMMGLLITSMFRAKKAVS